jgi:hypothetical protein
LDDRSARVFPYNIFTYCSICRVDCKFATNKNKEYICIYIYYDDIDKLIQIKLDVLTAVTMKIPASGILGLVV